MRGMIFFLLQHPIMSLKRVIKLFQLYGLRATLGKIKRAFIRTSYKGPFIPLKEEVLEEMRSFSHLPLISLITPTYNIDKKYLKKTVESVIAQYYNNWELCLVDDGSSKKETISYLKSLVSHEKIKVSFLKENQGISKATNKGIEISSGEYVAFLDHDDELTPHALFEVIKVINDEKGEVDFIYSDEDFILPNGKFINPYFRPDFSPDLLLNHNYIAHLVVYRREVMRKVGDLESRFDGAQDYDYLLRMTEEIERRKGKIVHIPKVLYHWRMIESSTALSSKSKPEAHHRTKLVLEAASKRRQIQADIISTSLPYFFRFKREIKGHPLVSIIIPFRDEPRLLEMVLCSILKKSTYSNIEILGIDNGSILEETRKIKETFNEENKVRFFDYPMPFNYSAINNFAVQYAKGDHLILLNNDIEIITDDWIEAMLEHSQRTEVGAVGMKLLYPNNRLQHAGVVIGINHSAGHAYKGYHREEPGHFNRLNTVHNVSAVTGAALMVKRSLYEEMGGLNEFIWPVAFNDVDFCLRLREKNYLNIFTPYAVAYHHESVSRGYEDSPEKKKRFEKERRALVKEHEDIFEKGDPYYNVNLTLEREDFSIKDQRFN